MQCRKVRNLTPHHEAVVPVHHHLSTAPQHTHFHYFQVQYISKQLEKYRLTN
jgi:hypothetical protein